MKVNEQPSLPSRPESDYDRALQQMLSPLLGAFARKLNQLGDGKLSGRDDVRTAAPTAGAWQQGDFITNSAPAEAGAVGAKYVVLGWVCTVSGTPGTWLQARVLTGN